jgi:hypothetical protein
MNANNINKQHKLVAREEKIPRQKQKQIRYALGNPKMRSMYAPGSRRFEGRFPCSKLRNETCSERWEKGGDSRPWVLAVSSG